MSLLPCPFCGGPAQVAIIDFGDGSSIYYGECINAECCVAFDSSDTEAEAVAKWNRRSPPPTPNDDGA